MARLYCPKESIHGKQIVIDERKQTHYLRDVLRLKVNDDIFIFDGQGNEYRCKIKELSRESAKFTIKEQNRMKAQHKINLAIACALPKQKARFDDLIDKLSQLGVGMIIPMITERVIVSWDSEQRQHHQQRWRKIAEQACIQSGRNTLPVIEPIKEISQILTHCESYDLKLIPTLTERKQNLKDIISTGPIPRSIFVLIGPEGDFTIQELTQAKKAGFLSIFLGDLILRLDTAAISVAAFFRLHDSFY